MKNQIRLFIYYWLYNSIILFIVNFFVHFIFQSKYNLIESAFMSSLFGIFMGTYYLYLNRNFRKKTGIELGSEGWKFFNFNLVQSKLTLSEIAGYIKTHMALDKMTIVVNDKEIIFNTKYRKFIRGEQINISINAQEGDSLIYLVKCNPTFLPIFVSQNQYVYQQSIVKFLKNERYRDSKILV